MIGKVALFSALAAPALGQAQPGEFVVADVVACTTEDLRKVEERGRSEMREQTARRP